MVPLLTQRATMGGGGAGETLKADGAREGVAEFDGFSRGPDRCFWEVSPGP
jgi:hypothetical protein